MPESTKVEREPITVSQKEAARLLGKSSGWLRKLALADGGPPRVKLGRSVLYPLKGLRTWIERNTLQPS